MPIDATRSDGSAGDGGSENTDEGREGWFEAGLDDDGKEFVPPSNPGNLSADAGDGTGDGEGEGDGEGGGAATDLDPPEFWSKEKKALWEKADPELRQAILDHDKEARGSANKRIEEAATQRKEAERQSQEAIAVREQLAAWWKQTGPVLAQQFQSKWNIDWQALAKDDPARYVALTAQRDQEAATLSETIKRHEAEVQASDQRATQALQATKRAEHEKLATEMPEFFGKPEVAQKTYDELSTYLQGEGIPADRIPNIYEASVIKIAHKAMMYSRAVAAAKKANAGKGPQQQTGVRVTPGPKSDQVSRNSGATKASMAKLRSGERLTRDDAALFE